MESIISKQGKSLLRSRVTMYNCRAIIKQNSLRDAFCARQKKKSKGGELQMKVLMLSSRCCRLWGACGAAISTQALSSPRLQQVCHHVQYSWVLCGILTRVFLVKWILYPEIQGTSFSFRETTIFLNFCLQMIFQIGMSLCSKRLFNSAWMF